MVTTIHTDGAYSSDRNVGGWACLVDHDGGTAEYGYGKVRNTTNNRMEMVAIIMGLRGCNSDESARIYTDSELIVKQLSGEYAINKNLDLWEDLRGEIARLTNVTIQHIPRNSVPQMEEADRIAKRMTENGSPGEWSSYGASEETLPENTLAVAKANGAVDDESDDEPKANEPTGDGDVGEDDSRPAEGSVDPVVDDGGADEDEPEDPAAPNANEKAASGNRRTRKTRVKKA